MSSNNNNNNNNNDNGGGRGGRGGRGGYRGGRGGRGGNRGGYGGQWYGGQGYGGQGYGDHLNSVPQPFAPLPPPPPGQVLLYRYANVEELNGAPYQIAGGHAAGNQSGPGYQAGGPYGSAPSAPPGLDHSMWAPNQGGGHQGNRPQSGGGQGQRSQGGGNQGGHSQAAGNQGGNQSGNQGSQAGTEMSKSKQRRMRKQKKRRENLLANVTGMEASLDDYEDGDTAISLKKTGGGRQVNIIQEVPGMPGSSFSIVDNEKSHNAVYHAMTKETGTNLIGSINFPMNQGRQTRRRVQSRPLNFPSGETCRVPRAGMDIVELDDEMADVDDASKDTCGNCEQPGHTVIECWDADNNGVIHGCACCNAKRHTTEQCESFPKSLEEQVELLVHKRGNLPPLASPRWYPIMYEYMYEVPMAQPKRFPWTPEFALEILDDPGVVNELKATAGQSKDKHVDPATATWETVKSTFGGEPAILTVALMLEKRGEKFGGSTVSGLRPSRIFWHEINESEQQAIDKAERKHRVSVPLPK